MVLKSLKKHILNIFLVITGGLLFALSNPNPLIKQGFAFTVWFMYLPYLFLIKKSSLKSCWLYSGLYGLLAVLLYAYWLYNYNPLCLVIALVVAFIGTGLLGLALKAIEKFYLKNAWFIQFLAICTFEYLRSLGFMGFHYGLAAYSQWNMQLLLQSVSVIGVFGLNFFVILSSAIIFAFLSKLEDRKEILKKMIGDNRHYDGATYVNYVSENEKLLNNTSFKLPAIMFFFWLAAFIAMSVYGFVSLKKTDNYQSIKVAAIQHNDDANENNLENFSLAVQQLIKLTDEALEINPDIDYVIWPETAVVPAIIYNYNQKENTDRKKLVTHLLNYIDARSPVFVIGNQHIAVKGDGSSKELYNSSLVFEAGKNVIPPQPELYSKIHLVPFSEYFPYEKLFPHIYKSLLAHEKFFWNKGNQIKVFNNGPLDFYTPICFEDTFPDLCRKAYKNGARCFFSLTNDSWSKSESCQYQHLAMARFRAVENQVPVVISSVSGQSAIIDYDGSIMAMAQPFTKSYVTGQVKIIPRERKATIYNKIGDIFGYGTAFLLLLALLIRLFVVIIKHITLWQSAQN